MVGDLVIEMVRINFWGRNGVIMVMRLYNWDVLVMLRIDIFVDGYGNVISSFDGFFVYVGFNVFYKENGSRGMGVKYNV